MDLYFRNNPLRNEIMVKQNVAVEDVVEEAMIDLATRKPNYKSYYQRVLKMKQGIVIDFGSYDEVYLLS